MQGLATLGLSALVGWVFLPVAAPLALSFAYPAGRSAGGVLDTRPLR